ncbi:MAG: hypothetical protein OEZ39_12360 [Gammaproteobacteria bacterium]|nr:hypothetical protein [Gammaproteobacteria bacterium]MDH5652638.1 hypothetical protein [Gammaproteobacteria bacterium]
MSEDTDKYYIMTSEDPDRMLLYSMPDLPEDMEDDWMFGTPFTVEPDEPIEVEIQEGFEKKKPLPWFDGQSVASKEFVNALVEVGVDNIMVYDAVLVSENGKTRIEGYKAINVIGLVKAAGPGTVYLGDSRLIDAGIDGLELEPRSIKGLLMFRLAEDTSAVVVHEKVKKHLEAKGFESLVFTEPGEYFSL